MNVVLANGQSYMFNFANVLIEKFEINIKIFVVLNFVITTLKYFRVFILHLIDFLLFLSSACTFHIHCQRTMQMLAMLAYEHTNE